MKEEVKDDGVNDNALYWNQEFLICLLFKHDFMKGK